MGGTSTPSQATQSPNSLYTPFASVTQNGTSTTLNSSPQTLNNVNNSTSLFNNSLTNLSQLAGNYNYTNALSNPYTTAAQTALTTPINEAYNASNTALANSLNAQGQLGSSYGAYQQYLNNQNYGNQLNTANAQGVQTGLEDYLSQFGVANNTAQTLGNAQSNYINQAYMPLTASATTQSSLNPLVASQLGYYNAQNAANAQILGTLI